MTRRLSAVVLAAGRARRFGDDKLLRVLHGAPVVAHAIAAARAAPVDRILVVKRPGEALDAACRAAADDDRRMLMVEAESDALSVSLRAGLHAAEDAAGVFVFLGDMPAVPHDVAARLAALLGEGFAAVPMFQGRQGHPVLLSARACVAVRGLSGDQGAGALLRRHASEVAQLDVADEGVVLDIDTPDDLERLAADPSRS